MPQVFGSGQVDLLNKASLFIEAALTEDGLPDESLGFYPVSKDETLHEILGGYARGRHVYAGPPRKGASGGTEYPIVFYRPGGRPEMAVGGQLPGIEYGMLNTKGKRPTFTKMFSGGSDHIQQLRDFHQAISTGDVRRAASLPGFNIGSPEPL